MGTTFQLRGFSRVRLCVPLPPPLSSHPGLACSQSHGERLSQAELLTWDRRSRRSPAQRSPAGRGNRAAGSSGTETARTSMKKPARESHCCCGSFPCLPAPRPGHPPARPSPSGAGSTALCGGGPESSLLPGGRRSVTWLLWWQGPSQLSAAGTSPCAPAARVPAAAAAARGTTGAAPKLPPPKPAAAQAASREKSSHGTGNTKAAWAAACPTFMLSGGSPWPVVAHTKTTNGSWMRLACGHKHRAALRAQKNACPGRTHTAAHTARGNKLAAPPPPAAPAPRCPSPCARGPIASVTARLPHLPSRGEHPLPPGRAQSRGWRTPECQDRGPAGTQQSQQRPEHPSAPPLVEPSGDLKDHQATTSPTTSQLSRATTRLCKCRLRASRPILSAAS